MEIGLSRFERRKKGTWLRFYQESNRITMLCSVVLDPHPIHLYFGFILLYFDLICLYLISYIRVIMQLQTNQYPKIFL